MTPFDVDSDLVRKLSDLLKETGLTEVEYQQGEQRIRVSMQQSVVAPTQNIVHSQNNQAMEPSDRETVLENAITAPMVGTVYLSPEPGAPSFAKAGDQIQEGQTVMIIEAMKVMNQIRAPKSGRLTRLLVTNQQPVEFGEPLFVID